MLLCRTWWFYFQNQCMSLNDVAVFCRKCEGYHGNRQWTINRGKSCQPSFSSEYINFREQIAWVFATMGNLPWQQCLHYFGSKIMKTERWLVHRRQKRYKQEDFTDTVFFFILEIYPIISLYQIWICLFNVIQYEQICQVRSKYR